MQQKLFQPLAIGPCEARNRVVFGSHTTNYAQNNLLSTRHADYYAARAQGGAGMIVLEEHIVHPSDLPYEYALLGYLPGTAVALATVTDRLHRYDTLAIVQLNHNGQQSTSDHRQQELWAPSAVPDVASREVPKVMEQADILAVIAGFAQVAHHAVDGKADGIELQISDRSLLRQFLSPLTNQRTDAYGGPLENRLRFVQETIEAVDAALGTTHALGVRLCADELAPWAGLTPEQACEIARLLTETGRIDYLTITMGSIFSTHMFPFQASMHTVFGYATHLAAAIKAVVNVPVFAAGRITNAPQAERILADQQADGVEMIRALIADPALPHLSQAEHTDEVRPCISCNQGCQVRGVMNVALGCTVNPAIINLTSVEPVSARKVSRTETAPEVVIVGGGPAGMEAARTAALRGRRVALYEREATLGGTVALAAQGPGRGELRLITDYLQRQLELLGVDIHVNAHVTAEMLLAQRPEAVLIATGAHTGTGWPALPGHDLPHVTDMRRILRGERPEGSRVVFIDETASHGLLSAAELLASEGRHVEIVTEEWYVGRDLVATHDIVQWLQRVMALGVELTPHTTVTRIESGTIMVRDRFVAAERSLAADVVVLGVYDQPAQELYTALKGRLPRLHRAGDCIAPRRIEQAILEGRRVGEHL